MGFIDLLNEAKLARDRDTVKTLDSNLLLKTWIKPATIYIASLECDDRSMAEQA